LTVPNGNDAPKVGEDSGEPAGLKLYVVTSAAR